MFVSEVASLLFVMVASSSHNTCVVRNPLAGKDLGEESIFCLIPHQGEPLLTSRHQREKSRAKAVYEYGGKQLLKQENN